jgi:peptide/nickel transport system substrate-binding protein/oligopeptide transport system substrate-binding protein
LTATTRVVNPGLPGDNGTVGERWVGRTMEERRALATSRVAQWKAAGRGSPQLRIALPDGPGADLMFARIAADLTAIGLAARRVGLDADSDLRLIDSVASYAAPAWFFSRLSCISLPAGCSPAADRFASAALLEPDPVKRAELHSQAEAQLTVANGYIPFGVPVRWSLVGGSVTGFAINRLAVHPLMSLAMLPR